jgi:hypothetical protein
LVAGTLFVAGSGVAALSGAAPDRSATVRRPGPTASTASAVGNAAADPPGTLARDVAVEPLLRAREAAVRTGRRADWAAGIDPQAKAFRARQLTVFDRIGRLRPTAWSYRLVDTQERGTTATPGAASTFVAHVRLHYRLVADTRDVVREQYLTVVGRSGRWYLADDADQRAEPALWDLGELTVRRGRRCLVIGIGRVSGLDTRLRSVVTEADAAAAEVDAVWGATGPRTAVVLVPTTRRTMARALGRQDDDALDQVAAVTSGELNRASEPRDPAPTATATTATTPSATDRSGGAADRVVLNPGPFAELTDLGRRVVLTHELTHVATRATARLSAPLWVEEGFANYVAYRSTGLDPSLVAADVLALERAGTAPQHLPEAVAFDPEKGPIAVAYADAWLAFHLMAVGDRTRPVTFYRTAAGLTGTSTGSSTGSGTAAGAGAGSPDQALQRAFADVLGTTQGQFEARWRESRHQLATLHRPS